MTGLAGVAGQVSRFHMFLCILWCFSWFVLLFYVFLSFLYVCCSLVFMFFRFLDFEINEPTVFKAKSKKTFFKT